MDWARGQVMLFGRVNFNDNCHTQDGLWAVERQWLTVASRVFARPLDDDNIIVVHERARSARRRKLMVIWSLDCVGCPRLHDAMDLPTCAFVDNKPSVDVAVAVWVLVPWSPFVGGA